jgi:hypothetical protein
MNTMDMYQRWGQPKYSIQRTNHKPGVNQRKILFHGINVIPEIEAMVNTVNVDGAVAVEVASQRRTARS